MMKIYKGILFVAMVLLLSACSTPEKLLCRTWKVDAVDFNQPKSEFEAKIQQSIKQMAPDLTFTFKPDSTYKGGKSDEPNTGRWWFIDNKKAIMMTSEQQQTNGKILTLNKTKLVINNTGPQGNTIKFSLSPLTAKK